MDALATCKLRWPAVRLLIIVVGLTLLPGLWLWAAETGFVRVMDLTMRSGPGKQTRPIKTLERGALVTILERRQGWLKIRHQGHTGYILNDSRYVRLIEADGDTPAAKAEATGADTRPQRRQALELQLKDSTAELTAMQDKAAALVDAVDKAERLVNRKRRQVSATESELGELEARIGKEKAQLAELEARIDTNAAYAGRRVRALHQLNSLGTLPVLANAESWMDFLRRKTALAALIASDRRVLDDLAADRQRQAALLALLDQRRTERQALEKALRQELADLSERLAERTAMLAEIQNKKSLQSDLVKGLAASAKALDTAITRMAAPDAPADSAAPQTSPAEQAPAATVAAAVPAERAGAPGGKAQPFKNLKGLLNLPVSGKIVSSYGHYRNAEFNVMNFRSGVLIRADRGEPIHAVANGTTLFADWFKGYGNMLIIDHGDHYYTVYAHLEALFKARGEPVDADEVIATVGDTTTLAGPGLHFEVRHHGKPMDPLPWLQKTDRAASDRKKGVDG